MKYGSLVTLFSAAVLAVGTLAPAFAQYHDPEYATGDRDYRGDADYDNGAAQRWHRFLDQDENRDFARRFHGNPNIIHDPREMDQWTGVRELFSDHPDVRDYVLQKVRDYDQNTRPSEKWDRELAANPNFADRYRQNPGVIDSNLDRDEPEIAEFLRTNPDVRPYLERDSRRDSRDYHDEDRY